MLGIYLGAILVVLFAGFLAHDAYALSIYLRPDGLGSGNNWPAGTYKDIDESNRDDGDYVTSNTLNQNDRSSVVYSLSGGVDPMVDIDHVIRYTVRDNGASTQNNPSLIATLQQGDVALTTWTENGPLPTTFTLVTHEIPPEVAAQISNYNDLNIKFTAQCKRNVTCVLDEIAESLSISWVELQYEIFTTSRDHPSPQVSGIGFYKINSEQQNATITSDFIKNSNYSKQSDVTDLENYVNYAKTGRFYEIGKPIPAFSGKTEEPIQVQVKLQGVFASTRIEHLSLISTNTKSNFKLENFEIMSDKGKKTTVIDSGSIIKDAKSTQSLEDGSLWVNFDVIFQKPLAKSNIVLQAWDELRRPSYAEIIDAWEIIDPNKTIIPTTQTFDRVKISIIEKITESDCAANKSCYDPSTITINKGGSIVWKNEDDELHTVVSGTPKTGPDGKFNFAITPHQSREKVFPFAGTYQYYCSLHPWYTGTISVLDNTSIDIPNHQYIDFQAATSTGITITNGQSATLDHNPDFLLSGHIPDTVKRVPVEISVKRPDKSVFSYSIKTTKDGHYSMLLKTTQWQHGKFEIASKYNGKEIGQLNFTITSVIKKKQM